MRGRLPRLVTAVLGVALLLVAVVGLVRSGRAAAQTSLDHALTTEASSNADAFTEFFQRAQSIDLLLAHDTALRHMEPGLAGARSQPSVSDTTAHAGEAMIFLQRLYPGRISEACLVDRTGTELVRVVRGAVAPPNRLLANESGNEFFAPTMRLAPGRVYQATPYVSPDTGSWVISTSTPIAAAGGGPPWGLAHFEVPLSSFKVTDPDGDRSKGFAAFIVDGRTGQILPSTTGAQTLAALGAGAPAALRGLLRAQAPATSATLNGHRMVVARMPAQRDNANSWGVVVMAPASAVGWSTSIGPAAVAVTLAALLLLVFAGLSMRASNRDLRRAGLFDELTGRPNRRLLTDRIDRMLLSAERTGAACAVLVVDLDRFKEVNDVLGYQCGDRLLRAVADRLGEAFRASDTVARLGGDQFAVLVPDVTDAGAALALARRCAVTLHEPFPVDGLDLNVEASIGLAFTPKHGADANAVLRAADIAMHQAKELKSGVVVYTPALDVHTPTRLALLGDLRRALHDGELVMHYQPKVDLRTTEVHGVEALVRWMHPKRGMVPPSEFIPGAERTGLILPLTMRTLDLAVAQARQWSDRGAAVQVAVNLSPRCLVAPHFPASVRAVLDRHALPPRLLRLELTEGMIMANPVSALAVLTELQQAGIPLSIDDFGTGCSSLSYLKRLPVDELKIDQSFIADLLADEGSDVLVRSSIELGHNLGRSIVAEGVEDQATLTALAGLGCDFVQGYYLAPPMPAAALTAWLDAQADRPAVSLGPTRP